MARPGRWGRWIPFLALAGFALAFQGSRGLWEPDEGRYAAVADQMLRTGDWWTPRLNHEVVHLTKPPLVYWSLAAAMRAFGRSEWALRLPNVLAFLGTALLVGRMGRRLAGQPVGRGAWVYATSLLPFVAANIVTADTLLTFGTTLAMSGFVTRRFEEGDEPGSGDLVLGLGFALAFLAKGPPGLLIWLGLVSFGLWDEGLRGLRRAMPARALAVFVALGVPWFALQIFERPAVLDYWLGHEIVGRLAGEHGRNPALLAGVWEAYVPVLLLGFLPWAFGAWRGRREEAAAGPGGRSAPEARLLSCVVLLPLAVFVASRSRLPLYLLPLAPGIVLAILRLLPAGRWSLPARWAFAGWVIALIGLRGFAATSSLGRDSRRAASELADLLGDRRPSEVLFVDESPSWGLGFYLGCEVERLRTYESGSSRPGDSISRVETLDEEIAEREDDILVLLKARREEEIRSRLAASGWVATRLGETSTHVAYWLEVRREASPASERDSAARSRIGGPAKQAAPGVHRRSRRARRRATRSRPPAWAAESDGSGLPAAKVGSPGRRDEEPHR